MSAVAALALLAALRLAAVQDGGVWVVGPARPTVGDTIWLERIVGAPAGWRVRAGRLDPTDRVEPLADPAVEPDRQGWRIRYGVVAWVPGEHAVPLPPIWLLGPDGRADSLSGGTARFALASVLPDTAASPKPALDPFRLGRRSGLPLGSAAAASVVLLTGGLWWRRRPPRRVPPPSRPAEDPEIHDDRWLAAGETRAVAARAGACLRAAIAHAVPDAHEGLAVEECLAVLARARPGAPIGEVHEALQALAEIGFGDGRPRGDVQWAPRARLLVRELGS